MSDKKKRNKKNKPSKASVMKKIYFKTAMYIIGIFIVVIVCKSAFELGVEIYTDEGIEPEGAGTEVVVTIPADSTVSEIASILKKNGLIENELIFIIQTYLYEADIYSGTYTLNTEYGPEELIEAMKPSEEEE